MSFFKKLNEHNTRLLASQINANGGKASENIESIIDNIQYLAEKGESFGEETRFIRLDVRRALASLCDEGKIVFKIEPSSIKWADDSSSVSLGGYLYLVSEDGTERTISSFACGGAAREDVYSQDMLSHPQRQSLMFSLASSRAESNAYYNAGIGIEFKGGDVFDLEAMEKAIPAPEPVTPEPKSVEERKSRRKKKDAAPAENINKEAPTPAETPEVSTTPISEPQEKAEEKSIVESISESIINDGSADDMTYEDALKQNLDIGTYAGQAIAVVLSKPQTARNIVWAYKNAPEGRSPELTKALEAAIDGYEGGVLRNYLNR